MSELLKLILKNYKAYITHKFYLASSMTYMYIAMVVIVPIFTASTIVRLYRLKGFMATITFISAISIGIILTIFVMYYIWSTIVFYYATLLKERRGLKKEYKIISLIWGLSFTVVYIAMYLITRFIKLPVQYVGNAWLLGIGLGNLLMGLRLHDPIATSVGIICSLTFPFLGVFPVNESYAIASLCMLYTYMGASLIYLYISKVYLRKVTKGVEYE